MPRIRSGVLRPRDVDSLFEIKFCEFELRHVESAFMDEPDNPPILLAAKLKFERSKHLYNRYPSKRKSRGS